MDGFGEWFRGLSAQDGADTPTRINANKGVIKDDCRAGLERIVFDFIANNDKIDITSHDNEAVFGMKNNAASRFVGMMMHTSCLSTFMNIPPQERNVVLAVFSQLTEIADSRQDVKGAESRSLLSGNASPVLRRAIWHMDELVALHNKGQLTAKNIIKTCFPDMPKPAVYNGAAVNRFLDSLDAEVLRRFPDDTTGKLGQAANALAFSGLPLKDILDAIDSGKPIPMPKYSSSGEMALSDITNTTQGVRSSLAGDLIRPSGYEKDGQPLTFGIEGFGFSFPGKARVFTNAANGKDNIKAVLDNIESFCGKAHVRQLQTVMNALSQSGIGANMINLSRHGVKADEHTAVNFSFSRNDETGDVTIRYSSPESLPFAFEWTATVNIDGNITTTPMRFTDETTLSREISDAAGKLKQMHITKGREGERDNAVDALLAKVKADSDLMALLAANDASAAEYILMDPNGGLRPEAEAAKRLEALRDNLNELRTAAKGDKRVFDSGLKQLALFSGKALKSGIIAKMCEMTGKEDIGAFRGISAASSPEKVFEAMCRLESMVTKVCAETKVMKTFNGVFGAEGSSVNSLILGLFFGRCDEQTLNGLKNAMYSANSGKMKYLLDQLKDGEFPPGTRLERPVRVASSQVADSLSGMFRRDMTAVLNNTLGIEEFAPPPSPKITKRSTGRARTRCSKSSWIIRGTRTRTSSRRPSRRQRNRSCSRNCSEVFP